MEQETSESPYIAPRLTLRVGVTGHRPNKLGGADLGQLSERAQQVLGCLRQVVENLQRENDAADHGIFARGEPDLRLATAIAEGADRIVAEAALAKGFGLNLVLPFPKALYAQDFAGEALAAFEKLYRDKGVRSRTELDVTPTPHDPSGYRAAGQLMLVHCEVLIAIWDRQPAAGIGGTAEIVEEAQRRGLVVVLITPQGRLELWDVPRAAIDPVAEGKWAPLDIDAGADVCSNALAGRVRQLLDVPPPPPPPADGAQRHGHGAKAVAPRDALQAFRSQRLQPFTWFSGYALLRRLVLGKGSWSLAVDNGLDRERSEAWPETLKAASAIGGEPFREQIDGRLRARWIGADNLAVHYAHRFRSAFIWNFTLAALAVFVGLLILFCKDSLLLKAVLVIFELALIGIILRTTWRGRKGQWQDRWLDYRSLAEALRPARLPVLIGSSPARPGGSVGATAGEAWIAWYVRAALREIAPPTALLGGEVLRQGLRVALKEEIEGQIAYHQANVENLTKLEERLEKGALCALYLTFASGALFLVLYLFYLAGWCEFAKGYKPMATFLGATLPVCGAAIFGIRATADFRTAISQSKRMEGELRRLQEQFEKHLATPTGTDLALFGGQPRRAQVLQLFTRLSRTLSDDLKLWGMVYSERELPPGF